MKKKIKKFYGFTLIEALVAVAIIAAVTAVTAPFYRTFQADEQLDYVAEEILIALRDAQSRSSASIDASSYGVYFEADSFKVFKGDSYPGEKIIIGSDLPDTLQIYDIDINPSGGEIVFEKNSGNTENIGSVKIRIREFPEERYTIAVNSLGLVRLVKGDYSISNQPPTAFSLLSPGNGAILSTSTPEFDWQDSTDPDGGSISYSIYVDNDSGFGSPEIYLSGLATSTYQTQPAEALAGGTYYWKARATDGAQSTWSAQTDWNFQIGGNAPTAFNLLSPVNGASVTSITPALDWEDSTDPDPGDTVTYTLYIDDNSDFSSPEIQNSGLSSSDYTVVVGDNLQDDTTYYWKVEATDGSLVTTGNQTDWSFEIDVPEPPSSFNLLSPASGSNFSTSTIDFDWEDSTDPDPGDTVTYTLYIDDNSDFSSPIIEQSGLTSSGFSTGEASGLLDDTTHYWKIEATDGTYIISSNQTNWYFDLAIPEPPQSFNLLSPTNGATIDSIEPTFDWEDSTDPDPGDTVTYTLYIDDNSDFSSPEVTKAGLASSSYGAVGTDGLDVGVWYWKVEATDGAFTTPSNQTNWSFNIQMDDWYVDQSVAASGNGRSWITAFKTIAEAVNSLNPGDTVNIADGTYLEAVNLSSSHSGSSGDYTEFINRPGDEDVVVSGGTYGFYFNGSSYIEVQNIEITGATYGVFLRSDADYVLLNAVEINSNSSYGVYIQQNNVDYLTIQESIIRSNGSYGAYLRGSSHLMRDTGVLGNVNGLYLDRCDDCQIYDSEIHDNGDVGIINNRSGGTTIHHVQIYDHTYYGHYEYRTSSAHVYNITNINNGTYGYIIYNPSTITSRNHIISGSAYGLYVFSGNASLNNDYNDVWGNVNNYGGEGSAYAGSNTISADPLFVNSAADDYRLQAGSPCINSGDPSPIYNDPNGSRADMGALPTNTP